TELPPGALELLGAVAEELLQLVLRRLELLVGDRELLGALGVQAYQGRRLERDADLIGERAERRELPLERRAGAHARLDVERADRVPRARLDRHARDALERQLVHGSE